MPRTVLLRSHRWAEPWPLVLRRLHQSGIEARIRMPERRIEIVVGELHKPQITDAVRRARKGDRNSRGVLFPSLASLMLLSALGSVYLQPEAVGERVHASGSNAGINCHSSMISDFSAAAAGISETSPHRWLEVALVNGSNNAKWSAANLSILGGLARFQMSLSRLDCASVNLVAELALVAGKWRVKKITRQP